MQWTSLLDLAPADLPNHHRSRYLGDDLCLPLNAFVEADQQRVRSLYDFLQDFFLRLREDDAPAADPARTAKLARWIREVNVNTLIGEVRELGLESCAQKHDELMAKTLHDLRGGGLTPLLGRLQIARLRPPGPNDLRTMFFLARDHLKIMRNALLGLDDPKREEDLTPKLHGIGFIVEKWQHANLGTEERPVRLEVDSHFHGNIAECCVEFGALDRALYNFINNACRHSAADSIRLVILPLPPETEGPDNLRFALCNLVSDEDARRLADRDLRELFQPGVSSTGSGFGMTVAADFVTHAFGLGNRDAALAGGYLGATLRENQFIAWLHWPIAPDV